MFQRKRPKHLKSVYNCFCMQNIYEVESANKWKSFLVVGGFFLFVTLAIYVISQAMSFYMGYQPGGLGFLGIALIISGVTSFGSYWFSDKIVLSLSGARPANRKTDFNFYTVTENLSIAAGIPTPKLYVIDDTAMNAFATGRDPKHASVCATTGLLSYLNRTELEGVVAHELSHIKNYDTRLMSLVSIMVGSLALLADWLLRMSFWGGGRRDSDRENNNQLGVLIFALGIVFAILSPIVAQLIQLAISRRREFMADNGAVKITRQPSGLIGALEKISRDQEPLEAANKATAHLYIINPFKGRDKRAVSWFAGLFNTHPPVKDRIEALKKMA